MNNNYNQNKLNQEELNQQFCKMKCGFFGHKNFEGYCSKCYKDYVKKEDNNYNINNNKELINNKEEKIFKPIDLNKSIIKSSNNDSITINDNDKLKKQNKCDFCKKKINLIYFNCRCGGVYCNEHRYSDKHNCEFNYKDYEQNIIKKSNPVIIKEKIKKI